MKFKDKLQLMRKKNNMSQETLSVKMNVTRQSVSKWESGASYPDMEKIISLTKVLNCTLEDLLDDGTVGNTKEVKHTIKDYLNDFLKYITNLYNMILAMNFKQKISCAFEMGMITIMLLIAFMIISTLSSYFIFGVLDIIPILNFTRVQHFFYELTRLGLSALLILIWFHLLKIRYLNYYITIEDQDTKEKVIEKEIKEKKTFNNNKKEVVIIRDPKDKSYSFFNLLKNIIILTIKAVSVGLVFSGTISLVCLLIILVMVLAHTSYNSVFLYSGITILGIIALNIIVVKLLINYLLNIKTRKNVFVICSFISIIVIGLSIGLASVSLLRLERIENKSNVVTEKNISKESLKRNIYKDNTECYYVDSFDSVKIDFKVKDIDTPKVIIDSAFKVNINDNGYISNDHILFDSILKDLKEDKVNVDYYNYLYSMTIELSKSDYEYIIGD